MGTLELLQVPFKPTKKEQKVCCLKERRDSRRGVRMGRGSEGRAGTTSGASREDVQRAHGVPRACVQQAAARPSSSQGQCLGNLARA